MIQTANLNIDPELCRRIDKAVFGSTQPSQFVTAKYRLFLSELRDAIHTEGGDDLYNLSLKKGGLYYLCGMLESIRNEQGRRENERMHANAQLAHTQLKAWEWKGLK